MLNIGRPVSLNRKVISEVCMDIYWVKGINNISYNDVIKTSQLSKGSFYKLFENEDDLQSETLKTYNNDNAYGLFDKISNAEDLFQMMLALKNWKFKGNLKYCYFFISYIEKYRMGIKTKDRIKKIELKYKLLLKKISKKHIDKYKIEMVKINADQLVNFIFNSIALISLLYRNKSSKSEIDYYKKSLYQFIYNLNDKNNYSV